MNYKTIHKMTICILAALSLGMLVWALDKNWNAVPFDFRLRYNEVSVLKLGHNPFDIWMGKTVVGGYQPFVGYKWHKAVLEDSEYAKHLAATGGKPSGKRVHAYPPWAYTLTLPFSYLPFEKASFVWMQMLLALTAAGFCAAFVFGKKLRGNAWDGILLASGLLIAATPALNHSYAERQWGPVILAALAGFVYFTDKKREVLAGLCWAVVMVKPQFGVLLFIPLAFARKWKTIAVAVAACLLLAIPPAVLCKTSPVDLILCVKDAGSGFFLGSGFAPWPVLMELNRHIPESTDITKPVMAAGAVAGLLLCLLLVFRLRAQPLRVQFAATVVCSLAWTYCNINDYILYAVPLAVIFTSAFRDKPGKYWVCASFAIVSLSSMLAISLFLRITKEEITKFLGIGDGLVQPILAPVIIALIVLCWLVPLMAIIRTSRNIKTNKILGNQ